MDCEEVKRKTFFSEQGGCVNVCDCFVPYFSN